MPVWLTWRIALVGGVVAVLIPLVWSWSARGDRINDLRAELAAERAAHDVTRASVETLTGKLVAQNEAIEAQRAATGQAKAELAAAVERSKASQVIIERLKVSAAKTPADPVCVASDVLLEAWK